MMPTDAKRTSVLQWPRSAVAAWQVDLSSVESLGGEIRWDLYPSVSGVPPARTFVIRLPDALVVRLFL
jgi:hypothetical protein